MKKWIAHIMNVERFRPITTFGVGLGLTILFYAASGYGLWDAYVALQQSHGELTNLRRLIDTIEQAQDQRAAALNSAVLVADSTAYPRFQGIVARIDTALVHGNKLAQDHFLSTEWNRTQVAHAQLKLIEEGALQYSKAGRYDSALSILTNRSYRGGEWSAHEAIRSAGRGLAVQRASIGDIFLHRIAVIGFIAGIFLLVLTGAWVIFVLSSITHYKGRREAENALRDSEEKYHTLIDALPHAVIIVQDFNVVFSNPAAAVMFGGGSSAITTHHLMREFIVEHERERLEGFFLARMRGEGGVPEHYTTVLCRLDGEEFPADVYVRAISFNGRPAMQAAIYDITERQRAEEALRESEERFRNLADMAPVLIWMAGTKRHTYYFNRTWLHFTGRTVGQEYGQGWQQGVHPEDLSRVLSVYENSFASRNSFTIEYRSRHADSTYHWVLDTGVPRFSQERSFTGYIGSCIDITARKDAEQALRENEERFRTLYNQTPVMMHSIDRNVQLVGVSDFWLETLGYQRKDVIGRRMTDFLTPSSRRHVEEHVLPLFFSTGRVTNEPYQFVKKNGEVLDTLLSATCERDADGQIARSDSVIIDITERKRMEAERETAQQMLRLVLDNIPVRVFWKDLKSRYLGCNVNFALDAGLSSPEEIVGKDDFQLSWLAQAESYRKDDREVIETGTPKLQFEEPQTWTDGTQLWLNTSKIPLRDAQGRVMGVLGTYENISARKFAEDALRRSEEKFLRAFRATSVLMAISTVSDGRFVDVNDTFLRSLGYKREEVIGKTSRELNLFVNMDQRRQVIKSLKENGSVRDADVMIRTHSGEIRHGMFSADLLEVQDGTYLLTVMNDITERKHAEEALRKRLEFENLVSTISTRFIHLSYGEIDAAINQSLKAIGEYAGADRSYVFQFRADGRTMDNTHEWCGEGITSASYRMQNVDADNRLPYFTPVMRNLDVFHIPRVADLPPEAAAEKAEFETQNIRSLICLPMHLHGRLLGFLGFDSLRSEQSWSDDTIALLRLVGEIFVNALDRKRSDEALHRQAEIIDQIHDAVITTDLTGQVKYWNMGAEKLYGYAAEEALGQNISFLYPDPSALSMDILEQVRAKDSQEVEVRLKRKSDEEFDAHLALTLLKDESGTVYGMNGYSIDITERKQAERELNKMNRALRAISECNQALVRASDETELLNDICRIIVGFGGYRFAWVGYAENDAAKTVRPAARAGIEDGYLEQIQITWGEDQWGIGPTGKAIRSGQPCTVRNIEDDPNYAPWRDKALQRGFRSSVAVPLRIGQQSFGVLNVYSGDPDAFDDAETELLVELADDLAFGMSALRTRAEHEKAVSNLAESEERYRTLFETMGQGVVYEDREGHITNANRAAERILGLSLEQMRGRTSADRRWRAIRPDGTPFPDETHPSVVALLTGLPVRNIVMGVYNQNEERYRWIEVDAVPQFHDGETAPAHVYTMFSDITERKEAEEALRQSEERFRITFHTSPDAVNINRLSDGAYVDINEGFTQVTGYSREDVIGRTSLESDIWADPADRDRLVTGLREVGVVRNLEAGFRMKDGSVRTGLMSARVILLNGEPHILSVTRDIDELKRAENAVRESEERYRLLADNANDLISRHDIEARFIYASPACLALTGYTPEELVGMSALDIIHPEDQARIIELHKQNLTGHPTQPVAYRVRHKDGQYVWFECSSRGVLNKDGSVAEVIVVNRDVSTRKQAEEERQRIEVALRLSEERFSKAFAASPMAVAVTRMDSGKILECNEAAEKFFEYDHGEVIGLTTQDLGLWKLIEDRHQIINDLSTGTPVRDREYQFVTKKGKLVVARYSAELIELNNEPCLLSVFVDITEHKRAEEAIRISEARYRLLADNVSDIISRHDTRLNYLYVSPACQSLGYETEELIGMSAAELIHPDDRPKIAAGMEALIHGTKDVTVEYRFRRKDGSYVWIESSARAIAGENGAVSELIVAGRDISARKRAEVELGNQRWRLESIIDGTHVGTWEWNVQTGETIFNETWAQIAGYTLEELSPINIKTWANLVHPDDFKQSNELLELHFSGERPYYDFECRVKHKDGHWVWIHDRGRVITFSADGKPLLMFGTHTDITERKQAEEALRLNESRLEAMVQLNQMKDESLEEIAVFTMEEAVRLTQSTIGYIAFANADETELTIHAWSRGAMQECAIHDKPLVYKVAETGLWSEVVRQRCPIITNDYAAPNPWKKGYPEGHVAISRHMNVPVFDDGKIVMVAGVGNKANDYDETDVRQLRLLMEGMWRIIQRKKAEDAVLEKTEELDRFFNVTLDLLCIADTDGYFRRLNREWEKTLGYTLQELEGHRFLDLIHPEDIESTLATMSDLAAGNDVLNVVNRYRCKDGSYRWIEWRSTVYENRLIYASARDVTESRRIQSALHEANQRRQALFEEARDAIIIADAETGEIVEVNRMAETLLRRSRDELIGMHQSKLHPPDQEERDQQIFRDSVLRGGHDARESAIYTGDGCRVPVEVNASMVELAGGRNVMQGFFRDITERKLAENTLRESEERYRNFIFNASEGIFRIDLNTPVDIDQTYETLQKEIAQNAVVGEVNIALAEMYGLHPEEMVGRMVTDFAPNCGAQMADLLQQKNYQISEREEMEYTESGDPIYIMESYTGVVDNGKLKRVWGVQRNVTARKRAEEAARRESELVARVMDTSPVGIVVADRKGKITFANQKAEGILGLSKSELVQRHYNDPAWQIVAVDGSPLPDEQLPFRIVKHSGKAVEDARHSIQWPDGRRILLSVNASPQYDENGKFSGMVAALTDITERIRADQALRESERRLHNVIQGSPIPTFVIGKDHRILEWNLALEELSGIKAEDVIGTQEQWRAFYSEARPCMADLLVDERFEDIPRWYSGKYVKSKLIEGAYEATDSFPIFQGESRWLTFTTAGIRDVQGNLVGAIETLQDITERKWAEEALRERQARIESILRGAPVGIGVTVNRILSEVNDRLCQIVGYTAEELIGQNTRMFYLSDKEWEETATTLYPQVLEHGTASTEVHWQRKDGQLLSLILSITTILPGNIESGMLFTVLDITERQKAEEALRERQARIVSIFRGAPVGIGVAIDRAVTEINDHMCMMTGYTMEELVGQSARMLYVSEEEFEIVGRTVFPEAQEKGTASAEIRWRRKDGRIIDVLLSLTTIIPGDLSAGVTFTALDITERKLAEEALRDRQARLASIFKAAPVGIGVVVNRVFTEVNETLSSMTGYAAQELIGQSARMLYPTQEEYDYVGAEKYRQIAEQGSGTVETHWVKKDGTVIDVLLSSSPIVPGDLSLGVTFTALDITERQRAAEALAESEQRFRMIAENAHDLIWTADAHLNITYVSPSIAGILGFSEDKAIGQSLLSFVASGFADLSARFLQDLVGDSDVRSPEIGGVSHIEHEVTAADGSRVWMEVVATALRDAAGKIVGIQGISRDVTERKQAEEVILRERDRAQMYLDLVDVIMVALNDRGEIALINKTGCRILGYEESELFGSNWFDTIVPPAIRQDIKQVFERMMSGGIEPMRFYENAVITKTGEERLIEWHNTLIRDEFGKVVGTLSSGNDITYRKRAEEELAARAAELERSNAELERFAYVASHDLQEPLRMMASYAQLLNQRYTGKLDSDADDFIGFITSGADRMRQLIHDLLAFSRVDTRGKPFEPVDCEKMLQDVMHNLQLAVEESGATITHDPLPVISADATQMAQLFQNLISNAVKFHGTESPCVHISATEREDCWEFSVRDNGIGIETKYFERIFIIFQRLHGQKDHPGTGIGLAICKKIIERHGGRISVESEPGRGTTFRFTLPKRRISKRRLDSHGSADNC